MDYFTTVTKKGQITIPKRIREDLELEEGERLRVGLKNNVIEVKPTRDFLEVAKNIKVRKKVNPVKAREFMEKRYERV